MQYWLNRLVDLAAIRGYKSIPRRTLAAFAEQIGSDGLGQVQTKLTKEVGAYVVPFTISLRAA